MKSCQIFKAKNAYKIITLYRLESWSYIHSHPIYILPLKTSSDELSMKIFEALENSRDISESEENEFWLGNQLLKELKEKSYNSLYKDSHSCMVSMNENEFIIEPQQYMGKDEGLEIVKSRILKFDRNSNKINLGEKIVNVLNVES